MAVCKNSFIYFYNLVLNFVLFILSYVIPKNKKLCLLGSGAGTSFKGNPKYLYLYSLTNESRYQISWITKNKKLYDKLNEKKHPVLHLYSVKGFWNILRAKYLIIEQSAEDIYYVGNIFGNFNFIQTWHGTPLKKIWYHLREDGKGIGEHRGISRLIPIVLSKKIGIFSSCRYKLILSPSKDVSNILTKASLNKNVKLVGYPRNDVFFNKNLIFENYKEKLNLGIYHKVILYCPTFRDNYESVKPFSDKFFKNLNAYLIKKGDVFLIKKHPFEKNIDFPTNLSNIEDVSSAVEDIQELLVFTDILITDYSSVFFDFILLDRPIIYYSYDFEEYLENCRGMYYGYYKEMPGPFAKNENELLDLIETINKWFNNEEYQVKYKKFKDKFNYYQDGKSCERLFQFLPGGIEK